jgi:guanylate kinase
MAGKLIVLSGPSGAGKSTIVKYLQSIEEFALDFSISATSRPKRENEVEGKDYYFLTIDSFKNRIEDKDFLEWEEVYPNQYYGTLKSEVTRITRNERNIILDVDVIGGSNIKRMYKDNTISIFIKPPSLEILKERLDQRKTDSEDSKQKRLKKAKLELSYARRFDHVIVNEVLETAQEEAVELVRNFLKG